MSLKVYSFWVLSITPLYEYGTIYLLIFLLMDIQLFPVLTIIIKSATYNREKIIFAFRSCTIKVLYHYMRVNQMWIIELILMGWLNNCVWRWIPDTVIVPFPGSTIIENLTLENGSLFCSCAISCGGSQFLPITVK